MTSVRRWVVFALWAMAIVVIPSQAFAQTGAAVVQEGDNEAEVGQSGELRSGDGAAGSQITGIVAEPGAQVSVTKSNTSEDGEAVSGDADSTSTLTAEIGPQALPDGDGCPELPAEPTEDDIAACVVQDGDNEAEIAQSTLAASGDAVASSQVTGLVASGIVDLTITQESEDAEAVTGDAVATNFADNVFVGPLYEFDPAPAAGAIDFDLVTAIVAQDGDNELLAIQDAASTTGDAVAGSQVTGGVVSGTLTGTLSNTSEDAEAVSGDSEAENLFGLTGCATNPETDEEVCGRGILRVGPWVHGADETSDILWEGDGELEFTQAADGSTGDAVAGGQVTGAVVPGEMNIDATNESDDGSAESGPAFASNTLATGAAECSGEVPEGDAACIGADARYVVGLFVDHDEDDDDDDNETAVDQSATAATGDAVGGAQVTGAVVSGAADFQLTNSSEDDGAVTGSADAINTALTADAACTQNDNDALCAGDPDGEGETNYLLASGDIEVGQSADASTGDAVGGGQVTGAVVSGTSSITASNTSEDAEAVSGDAVATNDALRDDVACTDPQGGDDAIACTPGTNLEIGDDVDQSATAGTGDAVAGGQVTGAVVSGDLSIDATNEAEDAEATSGDALADNLKGIPAAECIASVGGVACAAGNVIYAGGAGQEATATTGDAVAGGQVSGAVVSGTAALTLANTSEDDSATSGNADALNRAALGAAACSAVGTAGPDCAGGTAIVLEGDLGDGDVDRDDESLGLDQTATSATGDAVAGAQVTGGVVAGDLALDATNTSEDSEGVSGDADTLNRAAIGAAVCTDEIVASCEGATGRVHAGASFPDDSGTLVQTDGEDALDFSQDASAATGDAVAGGQVSGAVIGFGATADVVAVNTSEDAEATSGDASASNTGAVAECVLVAGAPICTDRAIHAGATIGGGATVVHDGDNEGVASQTADAATGDAVAGGQVSGLVISGGVADVSLENASDGDETTTGNTTHDNLFEDIHFGPAVDVGV